MATEPVTSSKESPNKSDVVALMALISALQQTFRLSLSYKRPSHMLGEVHTFNPSSWDGEAGGFL